VIGNKKDSRGVDEVLGGDDVLGGVKHLTTRLNKERFSIVLGEGMDLVHDS
jgi:hypothetical protein